MTQREKTLLLENSLPVLLEDVNSGNSTVQKWALKAIIAICILCAKTNPEETLRFLPEDEIATEVLRISVANLLGHNLTSNPVVMDMVDDVLKEIEKTS